MAGGVAADVPLAVDVVEVDAISVVEGDAVDVGDASAIGGILSGLNRGPVRLTLLARTKAHMGSSPTSNRHKEKDLEDVSWRT